MENLFMSLNNFLCVLPIWKSWEKGDYITTITISFVSTMSIISHLAENHKHGMPGLLGLSKSASYYANRLDVFGSILTNIRFVWLYYQKYKLSIKPILENKSLLIAFLLSGACMKISEYDNQNVSLKPRYLVLHGLWHLSIYPIMHSFLTNLIY